MEGKLGHIWLYYAGGNEVNTIGCIFLRVCVCVCVCVCVVCVCGVCVCVCVCV